MSWGCPKAPGGFQGMDPLWKVQGRSFPSPGPPLGTKRREERRGNVAVESLPELELFHFRIRVPPFGGLLGHRVAL